MVDITELTPNGLPIIFGRIEQEDRSAVKALIDAGLSIETPGFQQATPVLAAAAQDQWQTALMLLEMGANSHVADRRGFTLAWLAKTSRLEPKSDEGVALRAVVQILKAQGSASIHEPKSVKAMLAAGQWPPQ